MGADSADEIVSPLVHGDADRVCVVSASLVAECAVCGKVTADGGAHVPFIAYGFRCSACCPCRSFVPTDAELAAMADVRGREVAGLPVARDCGTMSVGRRASLERAWAAVRAKGEKRRAAKAKALTDQ